MDHTSLWRIFIPTLPEDSSNSKMTEPKKRISLCTWTGLCEMNGIFIIAQSDLHPHSKARMTVSITEGKRDSLYATHMQTADPYSVGTGCTNLAMDDRGHQKSFPSKPLKQASNAFPESKVSFSSSPPTRHSVFGQCTGYVLFGSVRNCANLVQSVDQVDM